MDLARSVETDGGAVDDEVASGDRHGRAGVGAGDIKGQGASIDIAPVDDRSARVSVGRGEDDRHGVESVVDEPRGGAGAVVHDAGSECHAGPLVDSEIKRRDAGTLGAAGGEFARAHALAGIVTGDDETAGGQVERIISRITERQGLAGSVRNPGNGVGQITACGTRIDVRNDKRPIGKAEILRGDARATREIAGVIACVTRLQERGESAGSVAGRRRHITGEIRPGGRPRDDVVNKQRGAVGDGDPGMGPQLAVGGTGRVTVEYQRRVVGLREVPKRQHHGAYRAVGDRLDADVVQATRQGHGADGLGDIGEITSLQPQGPSAHGDRRGVRETVRQECRAAVVQRQRRVVDGDGGSAGKTPFIKQRECRAIDQRAARIGVIAVERQGPRTGLVEEDASRTGGNITSPGRVGVDADEGGRGAGAAVYDDTAAAGESRPVGRAQIADHLAVAIKLEDGSGADRKVLPLNAAALGALPERILAAR